MIFNGMMKTEALFFYVDNDKEDMHFIEIERDCEQNVFRVGVCCDEEWEWKFRDDASNYELVKHAIFDVAFDAKNMTELINDLDEVFEEYFREIVVCECNCCCDNCNCK